MSEHQLSPPKQHNKVYTPEEFSRRLEIFSENNRKINKHNEGNHSFTSKKDTRMDGWMDGCD